ncbi:MAG: alpha/beta fold hydrolase, partial [Myxococcota bacterium]
GPVSITREGPPDGRVCLLVHGAPGSARDFRYLAPALVTRGFSVVRVDMPGFGGTPVSVWPRTDLEARAHFVLEVARRVAPRYSFVGHSVGGACCLVAAAMAQGEIDALVLVNSIGVQRHRGMQVPEQVAELLRRALGVRAIGDFVVERARPLMRGLGFHPDDTEALSVEQLTQLAAIVGGLDFLLLRRSARAVPCQTLVVSSEDDPLVEPRISHGLYDALRRTARPRQLHLATGGHYLQKHAAHDIALQLSEMLATTS